MQDIWYSTLTHRLRTLCWCDLVDLIQSSQSTGMPNFPQYIYFNNFVLMTPISFSCQRISNCISFRLLSCPRIACTVSQDFILCIRLVHRNNWNYKGRCTPSLLTWNLCSLSANCYYLNSIHWQLISVWFFVLLVIKPRPSHILGTNVHAEI